jgi:hypothetical protein
MKKMYKLYSYHIIKNYNLKSFECEAKRKNPMRKTKIKMGPTD